MIRKNSKLDRRAKWLAGFEDLVVAANPETAGKIDWDTAIFLFNQGISANDAAARYSTRNGQKED